MFEGTTVGGLSSITYDRRHDVFYAVSDDQANARFYTLALALRDGLADGDVAFEDVTTFMAPDGRPYPTGSLDPEGLALTKNRELILTSDGLPASGIDPFVRRYSLSGEFRGDLPVPQAFRVTANQSRAVVELLPLDDDHLIAMERSFSVGAPDTGNTIELYEVALRKDGTARKRLLLDLDELGIPFDNVEGMTFGPRLRHGDRSVVLVSDNNFAATQFTQFLLFALDG